MGKPAATAIRSGIPRAARVKNRQSRSAQRYSSMSVSCEPIRDRSGRRQAVAPLLTEAARRSTMYWHRVRGTEVRTEKNGHFSAGQSAGNLSLHGGKPARAACKRQETDKTAPILHRVLPDLFQRTESKPPQVSNQRKTKDYGKKAIDRTRKSGHGHADAQHSVCRIHSLHHPFLAHSLKEAPSPAAAYPQRQAAAIFLPSSRHSAYIRFFQAFRQGKRTGPAPPAGTKTENKKALARDARARCFK